MSEPKNLIEQLQRSNRRWKMLALAACFCLLLVGLMGLAAISRQQMMVEAERRAAMAAQARAVEALQAANSAQPR